MSFDIDPGTLPPLTGPGVVAGWYVLRPMTGVGVTGWALDMVPADSTATPNGDDVPAVAGLWVSRSGLRTSAIDGECPSDLLTAWERLRVSITHRAKFDSEPITEAWLLKRLRELNLHPTSVRDAQETT